MGNLTEYLIKYDKELAGEDHSSNFHNWLSLLGNFSKNKPFKKTLINKLHLHFNYFFKQDRNSNLSKDDPYLQSLPKSLRIKLIEFIWGDILNNFSMFLLYDRVNKSNYHRFYFEFVFCLLPRRYNIISLRYFKGEIILSMDDEVEEIFLILTGEVIDNIK